MIAARPSRWFSWWFSRHAAKLLARSFSAVRLRGFEPIEAELERGQNVFVVSNHTSWWDPLVALYLFRHRFRANGYALMDAKNLVRLPFFAKVGAFGVDMNDPRDGAMAMRYAAKLLRGGTRTLVWVFAQGKEVPVTVRPLGFRAGSAEIARIAPQAQVAFVAMRYEMGDKPEPALWVSARLASDAEKAEMNVLSALERTARFEAAVTAELDVLERAITDRNEGEFTTVMTKRPSPWGALAERVLAFMTRGAARRSRNHLSLPP